MNAEHPMDLQAGLQVVAAGLCCSLGYSLAAASAALRAELDHFSESEFEDRSGQPIRVARLPDQDVWGRDRYARWCELALRDALAQHAPLDLERCGVVVLLPQTPPTVSAQDSFATGAQAALQRCGLALTEPPRVVRGGKAALTEGLDWARRCLSPTGRSGGKELVLLLALDSHLHAPAINAALAQERLRVVDSFDGFIPGEAAACLLLQRDASPRRTEASLAVAGWAQSAEPGRPDGSTPSRAQGLTQALRDAMRSAQCSPQHIGLRFSDQNGEAFFSREAGLAFSRVFAGHPMPPLLLTLADKLGDVGVVTGAAMLAYLWHQRRSGLLPPQAALLHLADASGQRAAVVARHDEGVKRQALGASPPPARLVQTLQRLFT